MEKDVLGLYISGHPLSEFEEDIKKSVTFYSSDLFVEEEDTQTVHNSISDGSFARIAGLVTDIKTITTKSNQLMAFVTIEDLAGQMEVIVFPNTLEKYGDIIKPELPIWIEGKLSIREDEQPKIIVEYVKPIVKGQSLTNTSENHFVKERNSVSYYSNNANNNYNAAQLNQSENQNKYNEVSNSYSADNKIKTDIVKINIPDKTEREIVNAVCSLIKYFEGTDPVYVYYRGRVNKKHRVICSATLLNELANLLGEGNVKYEKGDISAPVLDSKYNSFRQ
jgi:DNA polymerase-3 subunit alpha